MKLDSENDRNILLELISRAQIVGGAAPVIADLIQRIVSADLEAGSSNSSRKGAAAGER